MDLRLRRTAPGICPVRDLIDVIANGGQFPEQCRVAIRRLWAQLHTEKQLPQKRLHFHSRKRCLLFQVCILSGRQPQRELFYILASSIILSVIRFCVPNRDTFRSGF